MSGAASRRSHAESLLRANRDLWLATSSAAGPHLVPLSYVWDREVLLFATSATSRTGRNLLGNGLARAAVGETRDLVIVVGVVSRLDGSDKTHHLFAARLGFSADDVGESGTLFSLAPQDIQAWTDRADDHRWVMRGGRWTT